MDGFKGMKTTASKQREKGSVTGKRLAENLTRLLNGLWLLLAFSIAPVMADTLVAVTVSDSSAAPQAGLNVYAFDNASYTGNVSVTDAGGVAEFNLSDGNYRFRIDKNGTQFFTAAANHCTTPACTTVNHQIPEDITVAVTGSAGNQEAGLSVYAFNGTTYANKTAVTDANGEAVFTLLPGDYRFRIDKNGTQFFTGTVNHCTAPGCNAVAYEIPENVTVTVTGSAGGPEAGLNVYAFDGATYVNKTATTDANGQAVFTLLPGDYRFRIDKNGTQYFTQPANHCTTPGCNAVAYEIPENVTISVTNSSGAVEAGLNVYAFNGPTYTGKTAVTDANGEVMFTLTPGDYRFRIDKNRTQYFTDSVDHCTMPGCNAVAYEIPENVTVNVTGSAGGPEAGLNVYAFDGATYVNKNAVTDGNGQAVFTLLPGDYRFRIDKNGTQFFTGSVNHCTTPGCNAVAYEIPENVTVTVTGSAGGQETGLNVYVFNGSAYTGKSAVTNSNGEATFTLVPGDYRFRIDKNGTQFFTGAVNHCTTPGCNAVAYEVPASVTVHVGNIAGGVEPGLNVYAFDGAAYVNKSAVTDANGDAVFTLLPGNYRFRIDKAGTQFFTATVNHCAIPGCTNVSHALPAALSLFVTDPNLGACIDNTAAANGWSVPGEVTALACDGLDITNLAGLNSFTSLGSLSLANNPLTLVSALEGLTGLTALDLTGVTALECRQLGDLVGGLGAGVVTEPATCLGEGEQVFSVANPDPANVNQFGFAAAATAQGNLAVSAITYHPGTDAYDGRVYLVDGTSGDVLLAFTNPAPSGSDYFGWSVAVTPDNAILVGAWQDDVGGVAAGVVYRFDGADGSLLQTLDNPDPGAGDRFGYALAALPDGGVAVGADGQPGGGAVYLFDADGNPFQTLANPTADGNAGFGQALALTDAGDLLIGAPGQDITGIADAGAVHVYQALGGNYLPGQTIEHPVPAASDNYGSVVTAGAGYIAVSAPNADNAAASDGSLFVHDTNDGTLLWSAANPVADAGGNFAAALAVTPQGNVVAGAVMDDHGGADAGRVFVFAGSDGALISQIDSPAASAGDFFGRGLAVTPYGQIAVGTIGANGADGALTLFTSVAGGETLTPLNTLFNLNTFPDTNLAACVQDAAVANGWATVEETTALDCIDLGITDITGLNALTALQTLDLSGNPDILCSDLDTLEADLPDTLITRPDPCNNGNIITSSSVQNLHNGAGQRVVKTVNGDASTAIHFIYDRQGRVIAEMDAATGAALREYIYVNGQQVALVDDSGTAEEAVYYVHNDHLGTPRKITDANQAELWAADYEPFGQAEVTTEEIVYNIRFPGQYADAESGLHYNYFRDYDPSLGMYVESDPIGLSGGINTYSYVASNPLRYIDVYGLDRSENAARLRERRIDRHVNRNRHNRCPKNEPKDGCDGERGKWNKDEYSSKNYHGNFPTYRGTGINRGSQCVYDLHGKLIDSGPFMGTYDYSPPRNDDGSINPLGALNHYSRDVTPHTGKDNEYTPNLTETF